MYFLGTFAGQSRPGTDADGDLDFFPFPTLGTAFDAEMGIDAPIDGFMLTKAPNLDGAKALLECLSTGAAQNIFLAADPNNVAAANDADTSGYTAVPEEGRGDHRRLRRDRPVPRPRHRSRTSRVQPACSASCRASWAIRTRTSTPILQGIQDFWDSIAAEQ